RNEIGEITEQHDRESHRRQEVACRNIAKECDQWKSRIQGFLPNIDVAAFPADFVLQAKDADGTGGNDCGGNTEQKDPRPECLKKDRTVDDKGQDSGHEVKSAACGKENQGSDGVRKRVAVQKRVGERAVQPCCQMAVGAVNDRQVEQK